MTLISVEDLKKYAHLKRPDDKKCGASHRPRLVVDNSKDKLAKPASQIGKIIKDND